jgi:hypothetical protein
MNPKPIDLNTSEEPATGPEKAPGGLSEWGQDTWATLCAIHAPAPHEQVTLLRAIRWWVLADELLDEATRPERAAKLKAAADASTCALRHWRTLKFPTDETEESALPPKIGRPSGPSWSAIGKAAQRQKLIDAAEREKRMNGGDPFCGSTGEPHP